MASCWWSPSTTRGKEVSRAQTPFFDPNKVRLNERAIANGDTYYFTTTHGEVYPVSFAGDKAKPLPTWSLVNAEERKQGWAPGGWQALALAPGLDRLYALMHEQHTDGKWEDPSTTIWAFDLKTGKKLGALESPKPVWSLQASHDKAPILVATWKAACSSSTWPAASTPGPWTRSPQHPCSPWHLGKREDRPCSTLFW